MELIPVHYIMEQLVANNDYETLKALLDKYGEDLFYELSCIAEFAAALPNLDPRIGELLAYWLIPQTDLWSFADFLYYGFYGYDHMSDTKNDKLKEDILTYSVIPIYLGNDENDEDDGDDEDEDDAKANAKDEALAKIISSIEKLELEQLVGLILWIRTYIDHGYLDCEITDCILKRCVDIKLFNQRDTLLFLSVSKDITLLLENLIEDGSIGLI